MRTPPETRPAPPLRTHAELMQQQDELQGLLTDKERREFVRATGVNGNFVFRRLPYADAINMATVDGMHLFSAIWRGHVLPMMSGYRKLAMPNIPHLPKKQNNVNMDDEQKEKLEKLRKKRNAARRRARLVKKANRLGQVFLLTKEEQKEVDQRFADLKVPSMLIPKGKKPFQHLGKISCHALMATVTLYGHHLFQGFFPPRQQDFLKDLCDLFRWLRKRTVKLSELPALQNKIILVLCKYVEMMPLTELAWCVHFLVHVVSNLGRWGPMTGTAILYYDSLHIHALFPFCFSKFICIIAGYDMFAFERLMQRVNKYAKNRNTVLQTIANRHFMAMHLR
jgi:hypothetical protein